MKPKGTPPPRAATVLYCLLFMVLSAIFLAGSGYMAVSVFEYGSFQGKTQGEVTDIVSGKDCSTVVGFTVDGERHSTRYDGCPTVGSTVEVRYSLDDPAKATAAGPVRTYVVSPIFAVVFLLLGLGMLLAAHFMVKLFLDSPVVEENSE